MSGGVDNRDGLFKPLSDAEFCEADRAVTAGNGEDLRPAVPVPADAPTPDWHRLRPKEAMGEPEGIWPYHMKDGGIAFYVVRWKPKELSGRKVIRPATWCRYPDGREGWVLREIPEARPLYNLSAILESPDKLVVVAEGEKCADAAARVFPDHAATTWAGGSHTWDKTDWQPLADRSVLLLADADTSGRKAMRIVADKLVNMGAIVRVYLPEGDGGRDIADWLDEDGTGATRARIEAEAAPWKPKAEPATDTGDTWADEDEIVRLGALPKMEYERTRKVEAKRLNIRVSQLDELVRNQHAVDGDDDLQGRPIEWNDPEPWPEPVDGAAILTDIAGLIRRHVDMPGEKAAAVAVWIVHTFLHDQLDLSTILNVTSATKRCGKTLLMEVVGTLVFRPQTASGRITPAAMFRLIEKHGPTLLLDEIDTFMGDDPELRGIVNGSQRREMAYVIRTVGKDHEPRRFGTWCPKAISGIGDLPDTVADRSITIRLERRAPRTCGMPLWRDRDRQAIEVLREKIARWTDDNASAVMERRNSVAFPSGLHDRARDAWEVLLATGEIAGGEWAGSTGRVYRACEAVTAEVDPETGAREMLLADIRAVFKEAGDPEHLPTGKSGDEYDATAPAILPALIAKEGRPWSEWSHGRPLSPRGLASLLKDFGVAPSTIRTSSESTPKGYKRSAFESHWKRYGIGTSDDSSNLSATTPQTAVNKGFIALASATGAHSVADGKTRSPASSKACGVVADGNRPVVEDNAFQGDSRSFEDKFDDADERAAILEFDAAMSRANAEWMAERQYGLEPGILASGKPGS